MYRYVTSNEAFAGHIHDVWNVDEHSDKIFVTSIFAGYVSIYIYLLSTNSNTFLNLC